MVSYGAVIGVFAFIGWSALGSPGATLPAAEVSPVVVTAPSPVGSAPGTSTTLTSVSTTSSTTTTVGVSPTTVPVDVPPTVTAPRRGTLIIHGTGDVALDPGYIPALQAHGWDHAWSGLGRLFLDDHLTVINLECVPSDRGQPLDKSFVFRCPTDSLPSLTRNGIEVANLGNNHSGDYGKDALLDGRSNLVEHGVAPVGVGRDHDEAGRPAVFRMNGWTVAVVGFGSLAPADSWYATADRAGMRNGSDTAGMVEAVRAAKEIADIVVVTIHWGRELDTAPRDWDVANAQAMIDAGADIIFGHHPHRMQPLEMVDGAAVFWSLGNFVWPRISDPSATTAVARAVVNPDGTIEACLIPAFIQTHGRPVLTGPAPCGPN